MLRIYGSARSRGVRTLWIAGELGLQYEHLDYAPRSPATRTPEYRNQRPSASAPTIDDDGFVLSDRWRSTCISRRSTASCIRPMRSRGAGLAVELLGGRSLDRQLTTYANNAFVLPEAGAMRPPPGGVGRDRAGASAFGGSVGKARWLAGNEFSIADLNVAAAMVRALGFDLAKWPKVHAWLHTCWDRPAAKRALAMRE
jgi:glutathione S-transferase